MSNAGGSHPHVLKAVVVGGLSTLLVATGLVAHSASAESKPQRVLQAINVDLGADGTLYGIKGVTVRKEDGAKASTDKQTFDPSKTAEDLPVRVLTSYRTAKKSGTNLADLKGYDGRVQIDVTVQNTTVRPQKLSYDAGGVNKSAYALVGVPLTVVASSNLGENTVDKVVTKSDSGSVTNGVLSQDKDGNGVVQWASMLAPPQLAPSTTFTLVMDADDFRLPSLDLSVQSGMNADPSTKALLQSAFGSDSGQQLKLQTQTIELIGQVTGVLAQANGQLSDVRKQLNFSAGELGDRTIENLTAGTERLASSTEQLATSLKSLGQALTSSTKSTQSQTTAALKKAVDNVNRTLGDPKAQNRSTFTFDRNTCADTVQTKGPKATVLDRLNLISAQLRGLSGATGECKGIIRDQIINTIGTVNPDTGIAENCPLPTDATSPRSVLCVVQGARDKVDDLAGTFDQAFADAATAVGKVGVPAAAAEQQVVALQGQIEHLQTFANSANSSSLFEVAGILVAAYNAYGQANALYGSESLEGQKLGALRGSLNLIKSTAEGLETSLQESAGKVSEIRDAVCEARDLASDPLSARDTDVLKAATGKDCAGDPIAGAGTSLEDQITAQSLSAQGIVNAATGAAGQLDEVRAGIKQIRDTLAGAATSDQGASLTDLIEGLDDLYNDEITVPTECVDVEAPGAGAGYDATNGLILQMRRVTCQISAAQTALGGAENSANGQISGVSTVIKDGMGDIADSGDAAANQSANYLDQIAQPLTVAASNLDATSRASIKQVQRQLAGDQNAAINAIDKALGSSLKQIDSSVSASTQDLRASGELLSQDFANVLKDLGSRDKKGSGLLGIVQAQAEQTKTSNTRVAAAGQSASSFGNVRAQDVDGIFLQTAQLAAALDLQSAQSPFAIKLPKGSQHVTVYAFHMREVK